MKLVFLGTTIAALTIASAPNAHALCASPFQAQTPTLGEAALNDIHGCWSEFVNWHHRSYNTTREDWHDRGWNDACSMSREYGMHWNATFLIGYGVLSKSTGGGFFFIEPFHGAGDYTSLARAWDNDDWHNDYRHQVVDSIGGGPLARSAYAQHVERGLTLIDLVQSSCRLYGNTFQTESSIRTSDPTFRAAAFIHESWHAWKAGHGIANPPEHGGHRSGQAGKCFADQCDYFYPHSKGTYGPGELHVEKTGRGMSHSVFQTQMEFLCDIADASTARAPLSSRQVAARYANVIADSRFVNGAPFRCGETSLLAGPIGTIPPPECNGRRRCQTDADCPVNNTCGGGCCFPGPR